MPCPLKTTTYYKKGAGLNAGTGNDFMFIYSKTLSIRELAAGFTRKPGDRLSTGLKEKITLFSGDSILDWPALLPGKTGEVWNQVLSIKKAPALFCITDANNRMVAVGKPDINILPFAALAAWPALVARPTIDDLREVLPDVRFAENSTGDIAFYYLPDDVQESILSIPIQVHFIHVNVKNKDVWVDLPKELQSYFSDKILTLQNFAEQAEGLGEHLSKFLF